MHLHAIVCLSSCFCVHPLNFLCPFNGFIITRLLFSLRSGRDIDERFYLPPVREFIKNIRANKYFVHRVMNECGANELRSTNIKLICFNGDERDLQ